MNQRRITLLAIVLLALGLLVLAAAPAAAAPPKAKSYAVVMMLVNPATGELDPAPACLTFTADQMCSESNECGPWEFVAKEGHKNEWRASLEFLDNGELVQVEARGVTERRGLSSSIGGTFQITIQGQQLNAGFGGAEMPRAACLAFGTSDD